MADVSRRPRLTVRCPVPGPPPRRRCRRADPRAPCTGPLQPRPRPAAELKGAKAQSDQAVDRPAEVLQHAADFPVLAFAQGDRARRCCPAPIEPRLDRPVLEAIDHDAVLQPFELALIDPAMHPHAITPQPARRRQLEAAPSSPSLVSSNRPSEPMSRRPIGISRGRLSGRRS